MGGEQQKDGENASVEQVAAKKKEEGPARALTSVMVTEGEAQDSQSRRPMEAQDVPAAGVTGGPVEDMEPAVSSEPAPMNAIKDEQHAQKDNDELLNAQCKGPSNVGESEQTSNPGAGAVGKEGKADDCLQ